MANFSLTQKCFFVSRSVLVSDTDLYGMVYHKDQWFLTNLTAKEVKILTSLLTAYLVGLAQRISQLIVTNLRHSKLLLKILVTT
jgi:hypothetical protein